jgi:hypothetical protein
MATLTPYQEQRKAQREEQAMRDRCAEAHAKERRLQEALRAWTKRRLAPIDPGLTNEDFPHLAHNWYLVPLHYGTGSEEKLAKARRVKKVMDQHDQLQRLIWDRSKRLVGLALRRVDIRYGAQWVYPKLP